MTNADFRLQQLLELRRRRRDEESMRLAGATVTRQAAEAALAGALAAQTALHGALGSSLTGDFPGGLSVADVARALAAQQAQILECRSSLSELESHETGARQRLAAAAAAHKAIDRLRERFEEQVVSEERRADNRLQEELAGARAARSLGQQMPNNE